MIPTADIQDQELAIRTKRTGIYDPAVCRCGDLGARSSSDQSPFSAPPLPSGAPNSFNLTPLTGIGTCPRNEAKATAGVSRPGSRNADSAGRLSERAASRASRAAGSRPCSSFVIRSLRLSTSPPKFLRAPAPRPAPFHVQPTASDVLPPVLPCVRVRFQAKRLQPSAGRVQRQSSCACEQFRKIGGESFYFMPHLAVVRRQAPWQCARLATHLPDLR